MRRSTSRKPHPQIHLPSLTANEALMLVNLFDRFIQAIWRAHGNEMTDLLTTLDSDKSAVVHDEAHANESCLREEEYF